MASNEINPLTINVIYEIIHQLNKEQNMKYETVTANGYWTDSGEPFVGMVLALGEWDGVEDCDDEEIFFYLDGAEPIGDHGDFVITETY